MPQRKYRLTAKFDLQNPKMQEIENHQLLKQIGEGKYGEIWLAEHCHGGLRALKIVRSDRFKGSKPYDREFYGIKKYEPVSQGHDELINILEVGRNEEEGFFYYTMELADDRDYGQKFVPEKYRAKTLLSELRARGSFSIQDCLSLSLSIVQAVNCMHQAGLVHRDIKPANIVYLNGTPRLADIGSVKLLDDSISIAGTPGYMPLEGPGRPAGDIFSLGRVLYEMVTGKDCSKYPESLDSLEESIHPELRGLRKIILKCCERMPEDRYPNADALARALNNVANPSSAKTSPTLIIGGFFILGILIYTLYTLLN